MFFLMIWSFIATVPWGRTLSSWWVFPHANRSIVVLFANGTLTSAFLSRMLDVW